MKLMIVNKKTCFCCKETKPIEMFCVRRSSKDGRYTYCAECSSKKNREKRYLYIVREKEYKRKNLKRILSLKRKKSREYARKNPEKIKAGSIIYTEVRSGRLIPPDRCIHCNKKERVQGHHEDYSKPFNIIWLCQSCHKMLHYGRLELRMEKQ